jgi:hypothetical protein
MVEAARRCQMAVPVLLKIPGDLGLRHLARVCNCLEHWHQVPVKGRHQFVLDTIPVDDVMSDNLGEVVGRVILMESIWKGSPYSGPQ